MSASLTVEKTISSSLPVASVQPPGRDSRLSREFGRNLWLALCCLLGFAWFRESPAYSSLLRAILLEPVRLTGWGQVCVIWLMMAKSTVALLPVLPLSWLLIRSGRNLWGRAVLSGWVVLIVTWLLIEQSVLVMTSNHASEYVGFLFDGSAWQWVGESATIVRFVVFWTIAGLLACWGLFESFSFFDRRWGNERWNVLLIQGSFAALVLSVLGWSLPRVGATESDERVLNLMERNLAWLPLFCTTSEHGSFATPELQEHATQAYANTIGQENAQPLDREFRIRPDERRHVVLFVVESFRRDLLSPETMPWCAKLSHDGLFLSQHYSSSNMSHYGLFSLMYGRYPFLYDQLLDRKIGPQACETFRNSGYHNTFITSGDCSSWLRMGEFLGPSEFDDVVIFKQKSWVERDRQAITKAAEILKADASKQPQFVVCFTATTHFPYEFPREFSRFQPVAKAKDVMAVRDPVVAGNVAAIKNRQKNAASFIDAEIGRLLKSVDRSQTLLVVTGDHAESFQDDGCFFHGSRLSDAQTQVPALFWGANVPQQAVRRMTSHVDVLPTLCSLLTHGRLLKGGHGRDLMAKRTDELDQVLLTHGRVVSGVPFERALLVSKECRLPMLLYKANGGAVTLLDPVDHRDRILPQSIPSAASLELLALRIDRAFQTSEPLKVVAQIGSK